MLLLYLATFIVLQKAAHLALGKATGETDHTRVGLLSYNSELASVWTKLAGCWSGVVTFKGIPAAWKRHSDYRHCCVGSTRMMETRVLFSARDGIPTVERYFKGPLKWRLDENAFLTLSGVVMRGINEIRNMSIIELDPSHVDGDIKLAVQLRQPHESHGSFFKTTAFECHDLHVQENAERIVMRSVVHYPRERKISKVLYACPHYNGVGVAASMIPAPVGCRSIAPRSSWIDCRLFSNASNALNLHEEGVTTVEYELARTHSDLCRAANLSVHRAWWVQENSSSSKVHENSSSSTLFMTQMLALVVVSVCVCSVIFCVWSWKLYYVVRRQHVSSDAEATQAANMIGANITHDLSIETAEASSADVFDGDFFEILACGQVEHWLVTPNVISDLVLVASGAFGAVFHGMMHRSSRVAVKTIVDTSGIHNTQLKLLQHEARILRRIRHPNVVLFQGITTVKHQGEQHLALVLEWIEGGDLSTYLRRRHWGNWQAGVECLHVRLLTDISRGLMYLHHQVPVIVHMDLKPENVLVEDVKPPRAKLTDFGFSMLLCGESFYSKRGTSAYMAPEVASRQAYEVSADMYSFGAIMWFVLTGTTLPIDDPQHQAFTLHEDSVQPAALVELCSACLNVRAEARPCIADAHALLTDLAKTVETRREDCLSDEMRTRGEPVNPRLEL
eukprot:TRINITY_DN7702_c0_g1_i3.p1 TRINITY_DN7702_c0_g1~~TRINITY_DN7702_c0_g1_i3.p1  ORF type:complete len:676 (+),score=38.52 TRINITY_DN7702_c0_g1_i3:223-2250(+)